MDNWLEFVKILIKVVFFVIVPAFIIYKRIKKRITTGFAFGAVMMSFIVALLSVASIYENPADTFVKEINSGNYEEAKRQYKIVIQGGSKSLSSVDENRIIYREKFNSIKVELITEYEGIAEKIYNSVSVAPGVDCGDLITQKKNLSDLKHALNLLEYSVSIGGGNPSLFDKISLKIQEGEKTYSLLKSRC